jgi:hypothetical protein
MHDQKQLHDIALDYPWFMFTGEEIAELCNVSENVIWRVKALSDSPFFLNKCRPEWFLEWMRNHPEFQLTKAYSPEPAAVPERRSPILPNHPSTIMRSSQVRKAKPRSRQPSVLKK